MRSRPTGVYCVRSCSILVAQVGSAVQVVWSCRAGWSLGE
jgi:hypothetical protein